MHKQTCLYHGDNRVTYRDFRIILSIGVCFDKVGGCWERLVYSSSVASLKIYSCYINFKALSLFISLEIH